ncbi:hypothetical protein CHO01_35880 [Cellulomonas hominis]|uniref:Lipoprotein n=1 Tax=Cellulomonas hominis TaxID=156981 RepID=A0A511FH15_9CELL|nr:hypothetical protein [Cellulomonas hominis]MBB5474817.1 hypothetical protein [Cellulomonas hominis]NKY05667.1 hypothetical protein [Cellulomonas hominis]GEL48472.1 hypothetical protein CHO01_35880 [Cellulomonas hominis]
MSRSLAAAAGAFALLLVGGCSPSAPPPAPAQTAEPTPEDASLEVELAMNVVLNEDGSVSVTAQTNLPDGTELGSSVFQEGGFIAQDSGTLQNGAIAFGPFSDKGNPVPPGTYEVSVTMPIARNQPDDVKAVIGDAGENLTGPLVTEESITGDAVVSVSDQLVVP